MKEDEISLAYWRDQLPKFYAIGSKEPDRECEGYQHWVKVTNEVSALWSNGSVEKDCWEPFSKDVAALNGANHVPVITPNYPNLTLSSQLPQETLGFTYVNFTKLLTLHISLLVPYYTQYLLVYTHAVTNISSDKSQKSKIVAKQILTRNDLLTPEERSLWDGINSLVKKHFPSIQFLNYAYLNEILLEGVVPYDTFPDSKPVFSAFDLFFSTAHDSNTIVLI